jgi:hypothetical protein
MPRSGSPPKWWRRAPGAAILGLCLLLASCDSSEDPPGPDETPATTEPSQLYAQPTPSDGGTVEIAETGFTILDQSDPRSVRAVWGATFRNTSQVDLLAYVDFDVTWRSADGETEVLETVTAREQRAYDVLPGGTAVIGWEYVVGFVPESLDVSVRTSEWAPMADLQARGWPVGVEVASYHIDAGSDAWVRVQVDFTSSYDGRPDRSGEFRITVALRDTGGTLLGAMWAEDDFDAGVVPGEREQHGSFRQSRWPEQADPEASQAMIVKVCCNWVGLI